MSIKSAIAAAAILTALGGAAYAQDPAATTDQSTMGAASATTADYIGQSVFDKNGQEVGTIDNVTTDAKGKEVAVISAGTYLGLGSKQIEVPTSKLKKSDNGYTVSLSQSELQSAPEHKAGDDSMSNPDSSTNPQ